MQFQPFPQDEISINKCRHAAHRIKLGGWGEEMDY